MAGDTESGRRRRRAPGALESEILAALWAADAPLTPAGVQDALGGELAYNTVQTILVRLHEKGLLQRTAAGRAHAYAPVAGAEDHAARQMHALLDRGPNHQSVLQRFVTTLSDADESALRELLTALRPPRSS
ncbi:BlaI/MecI/CopY family transcriptional regulator [uncultured Pseudonocardia sp.]|uniref:BlaI/MecI/CopY family transcriptional regulator n=1 Tax=uncultured Pseudonocardia sp. TaxID=211455 RepID=UPI0026332CB8|nr:BlaI/MecI/CopY family transcriptional regulator [uncultured Pseudonocardia sp.]